MPALLFSELRSNEYRAVVTGGCTGGLKDMRVSKKVCVVVAGLMVASVGATQVRELLKILGVGAVVQKFGKDINKGINNLAGHHDSATVTTKVVPIISGGIGGRNAVGAAQVMGPKKQVDQVNAVAQLDQDLFGREIKIRAMIPITSKQILKDLKRVEGVGISGIVDLKL
jgi:hypothetical protein